MKKKLSKQTIFTILGLFVILTSIPMAVLLVKQRQDIRKEAASCNTSTTCGNCGGNACSSASPNYTGNCRNLGNSSDCTPCYSCDQPAAAPPTASGQACGSWCQSQVGHSAPPWCRNDANPDPGYTLKGCTSSGISDNSYCCAFTQTAAAPPTASGQGQACGSWCQSQVGHSAPPWCRNDANPDPGYTLKGCTSSGISDNSYCCAFTQTATTASSPTTSCTPGQWSPNLCARCPDNGTWPQGGIACPANNLDFGSRNLDGDNAGYTEQAHCDCQKRCWGADKMTTNCGGPVPIERAPGNESVTGAARSWGLYKTGVSCETSSPPPPPAATPTQPTTAPTVTPTITPTVTPTLTPTPTLAPTATPTTTVGCNISCSSNSNCNNGLICSSGYCRNESCTSETSCNCPGPTATPTPTTTSGPTSTPIPGITATPTPVTQLPSAGFTLPTFGAIFGGTLFVIIASILFLL